MNTETQKFLQSQRDMLQARIRTLQAHINTNTLSTERRMTLETQIEQQEVAIKGYDYALSHTTISA